MDFISQFAVSLDAILGVDKDMTQYLDAHTHSDVHKDDVIAVVNRYPGEVCGEFKIKNSKLRIQNSLHDSCLLAQNSELITHNSDLITHNSELSQCCFSVGLHPWHVNEDWQVQLEKMRSEASLPCVCAIGECGLDKLTGNDYERQKHAFRAQVSLAEECGKPMIIHCVKAYDDILAIHKEMNPRQKWMIHGFRGKPEQAKQIMAKGMLLSFGHRYNVDTLSYVAFNYRSLYLETDDCGLSIRQIYENVRRHLSSGSLD